MVAKAASYNPIAMPTPITVQPAYQAARSGASDRIAWPAAMTTILRINDPRPPCRSIHRPTRGAQAPVTSSAQEKAPSTAQGGASRPRAAGPATMAGR